MEGDHADTSPATGVESADSSGAQLDLDGLQGRECIERAEEALERAKDRLQYGRRQECEEALKDLEQASDFLAAAKAR